MPYAFHYFDLESYQMGFSPELDESANQAKEVEEWVRSEIHHQGLEDTTEVFEHLVQMAAAELGLNPHTNKLTLLNRVFNHIQSQKPGKLKRDKLKKITDSLRR